MQLQICKKIMKGRDRIPQIALIRKTRKDINDINFDEFAGKAMMTNFEEAVKIVREAKKPLSFYKEGYRLDMPEPPD